MYFWLNDYYVFIILSHYLILLLQISLQGQKLNCKHNKFWNSFVLAEVNVTYLFNYFPDVNNLTINIIHKVIH